MHASICQCYECCVQQKPFMLMLHSSQVNEGDLRLCWSLSKRRSNCTLHAWCHNTASALDSTKFTCPSLIALAPSRMMTLAPSRTTQQVATHLKIRRHMVCKGEQCGRSRHRRMSDVTSCCSDTATFTAGSPMLSKRATTSATAMRCVPTVGCMVQSVNGQDASQSAVPDTDTKAE